MNAVANTPERVAIGLCADLQGVSGLDVDVICRHLERADHGISAEVVPSLCRQPEQAAELVSRTGARRLVLGLCDREFEPHEFQAWARKAALDPLALELVILGRWMKDPTAARALLEAALARQQAFTGSEPEQLRLRFLSDDWRTGRNSLVTLPPLTYEAVPTIDQLSCLGERLCGRCVRVCPASAIGATDGGLGVDKSACTACGLCVTECPVDTVSFPGSSLAQFEAELAALVPTGRRLIFTCRRTASLLDQTTSEERSSDWLPLEVPCLGMVTPGWVLQALAAGAPAVGLLSCGAECHSDKQHELEQRVAYVHELLRLLGENSPSERVTILPPTSKKLSQALDRPLLATVPKPGDITLTEPAATATAVLSLATHDDATADLSFAHETSPLGVATVDQSACTSCGTCATACLTGALIANIEDQTFILSYDARQCLACKRCVDACPEVDQGALRVRAVTDLAALTAGRVVVKRAPLTPCRSCGRPIAPTAMLNRMRKLLEGQDRSDELLETLTERCVECRGSELYPTPTNLPKAPDSPDPNQ